MEINRIYNENCIATTQRMADNVVDLTVTSPPYDDMRTYNNKATDAYSFDFEAIAAELLRVTAVGGVVVWVVGDQTIKGDETGTSFRQALHFKDIGFKLWDTMIYQKQAQGAVGNNKGYWQTFEYMFVLCKEKPPKTINLIKDRVNAGARPPEKHSKRLRDGRLQHYTDPGYGAVGRRTNIWHYNTGKGKSTKDQIAFQHPAIFPEKLAEDHIRSWSNAGDLVYDPFMGSGTVAKAAKQLQRNWVGSEISASYCELIRTRLASV